eukprot:TRINITY_DN930_c1_g1_i1.p1 TRINITY_DN930_c1_g1~~TRINITY_DN930_c1_g1_i1.p1  ORF type:complete len:271 (-),score=68.90 TRINITY_DN930_c1_g1_i1:211-1023(-)
MNGRKINKSTLIRYFIFLMIISFVFILILFKLAHQDKEIGISCIKKDGVIIPINTTKFDPDKIEMLSREPRLFIYRNFITDEEADYMIKKGIETGLNPSGVAGDKNETEINNARTSTGCFVLDDEDIILRNIENKLSLWTQLPPKHSENFYVLKYEKGQEYKSHFDFFNPELPSSIHHMGDSGQRIQTTIIYLNNVEEGGDTLFPTSKGIDTGVLVNIEANKGDAILFHGVKPNHDLDFNSLHTGTEVKKGIKYAVTKWWREKPVSHRNV